jgi:hypothetical protein
MDSKIALSWRTSSYSGNADGNCVEVALTDDAVHVRDSKDRAGGSHEFSPAQWAGLLATLRVGGPLG